jgi:hypothetical protein
MVAKCLGTCGRELYLPETQEETRIQAQSQEDKQVKLAVPNYRSKQEYISAIVGE